MAKRKTYTLAATGSTGNVTGASVEVAPCEKVAFQFTIEVAGATPTVTWKVQGSLDGNAWYDIAYTVAANDTLAVAAIVSTSVGSEALFLAGSRHRHFRFYRLVTSSNTNVTFRSKAFTDAI